MRAAVAAACGVYAASYLRLMRHFWAEEDDAQFVLAAGDWLWRGAPAGRLWGFRHGMGDFWLSVPFLAAFGPGDAALQWRNGTFGLLGIYACGLLSFELGAGLFGSAAAALLLALTPGWVILSERGITSSMAGCVFAALSLALWLRAARTGRPWLSAPAALLLGAALWTNSTKAIWALELAAAGCVGALSSPWAGLPPKKKRALMAACLVLFLLPQAPAVLGIFNPYFFEFWTKVAHWRNNFRPGLLASGLAKRLAQSADLLDARRLRAIPLAALGGTIAVLAARSGRLTRRDALPWIIIALYIPLSLLSPGDLYIAHLLVLLPLFWAGVCALAAKPARPASRALAAAALAGLLCWRAVSFAQMLRNEGPYRDGALPARALFAYFENRAELRPVFVGEAPFFGTLFYSRGRIVPLRIDGGPEDSANSPSSHQFDDRPPERIDPEAQWNAAFSAPNARFVILSRGRTSSMKGDFLTRLARRGLTARREAVIPGPGGDPAYDIYRLEPPL